MNPDDGALLSAFLVNYGIAAAIFIGFCYLRKVRRFSNVYSPLCHGPNAAEFHEEFWGWIREMFRYSQRWILKNRGLDAVMYLRFQKSCFVLFSVMTLFAFLTVIPTNAAGPEKDLNSDDRDYVSGLSIISFANVSRGSPSIWVHLVYLCCLTFLFMFLQNRDYQQYCLLRLMHKKKPLPENFTCCIQSITFPEDLFTIRDKTKWLKDYLNQQFDNSVLYVRIVWNEPELEESKEAEEEAYKNLERCKALELRKGVRATHLDPLGAKLIESVPHYTAEIKRLTHTLNTKRTNSDPSTFKYAFITFNSKQKAQICAQTNLNHSAEHFETSLAPAPSLVVWGNLKMKKDEIWVRSLIVYAVSFFLIVFYMIPIGFVQTLANLRQMAESLNSQSMEDWLNNNPAFESFFEGLIPPLILLFFMSILLPLLRYLSEQQGYTDVGAVEQSTLGKFYFFLVFHVFLATAIAGSLLNQFEKVLYRPANIIPLFSSSLPKQGSFFVTYVLLASAQNFFKLINFQRLGTILFFQKFRCESEREFREAEQPDEFDYVNELSNDLLVMQITLSYAVMFPIILPFSAAYFFCNLVIARYSIIFVCDYRKDTGGKLWPDTFLYMSVGIFICNITMMGVFGLYQFPGAITCLILLGITIVFTFGVLKFYSKVSTFGALDEITETVDDDDPTLNLDDDNNSENYDTQSTKSAREVVDDYKKTTLFDPFRIKDLEGQELLKMKLSDSTSSLVSVDRKTLDPDSEQINSLPFLPTELFSEEDFERQPLYIRLWYAYVQPGLLPPGPPPLPPLRLNSRAVWLSSSQDV